MDTTWKFSHSIKLNRRTLLVGLDQENKTLLMCTVFPSHFTDAFILYVLSTQLRHRYSQRHCQNKGNEMNKSCYSHEAFKVFNE